jgi:hypothetical protein
MLTMADVVVATLLFSLMPSEAYAYIDPGTGALLLQVLLAAFFGALFFARRLLGRLLSSGARLLGRCGLATRRSASLLSEEHTSSSKRR